MNCKKCGKSIQPEVVIDGKRRILKNRTSCLWCVPFGTSPYSKRLSEEERRQTAATKQRTWRKRRIEESGSDPIRVRRQEKKQLIVHYLGGCQVCRYDRSMRNLTFHHVKTKKLALTERAFQHSWAVLMEEIKKCVLLCANHHGEVHDGLLEITGLNQDLISKLQTFTPV